MAISLLPAILIAALLLSSCQHATQERKPDSMQATIAPKDSIISDTTPAIQENTPVSPPDTVVASLNIGPETNISLLSIYKTTTPDNGSVGELCKKWQPDSSQVVEAMRMLKPVSGEDWHHFFYDLSCKMEGEVSINSKTYKYSVNAGGFIFIYDEENQYILGCSDRESWHLFINIEEEPEE